MTRFFPLLLATMLLAGCGQPEPLKLGFISGQTGPFSDLGKAGLNGAQLAVEERNAAGGHPVTLLIGDDEHQPEKAANALQSLISSGVVAVVGPMTSSMATTLVATANAAEVVLMGGTIVTDQLTGKDDYLFRVIAPTRYYGNYSAKMHLQHFRPGRVAVVHDAANRDYAENWAKNYAAEFERSGVAVAVIEIDSRTSPNLMALGHQIMENRPELVTFATSARTAAGLMRTLRSQHAAVRFAVSAWAANHLLLELAGPAAEGVLAEQYHNLFDTSPRYAQFEKQYRERFSQRPDYAAVIAYDATHVLLDAITGNPQRQGLKMALLKTGRFNGLQGEIVLDQNGDATRHGHTTRIKDGQYAPLD